MLNTCANAVSNFIARDNCRDAIANAIQPDQFAIAFAIGIAIAAIAAHYLAR